MNELTKEPFQWYKTINYYDNIPVVPELYSLLTAYYICEIITHRAERVYILDFTESCSFKRPCWDLQYNMPKKTLHKWQQDMNINPKTFRDVTHWNVCGLSDTKHFIVAMPFGVWERFSKVARELQIGPRKTASRVFLYFYYWAMRFQGSYSRSRDLIIKELGIQKDNLAEALAWLEKKGFVLRSDYSKQEGYARRYYIPEQYWTIQCKKEWKEMQKSLKR